MSTPLNAAPYTNWLGIQDDSTAQQLPQPLQVPTHLPLCPLYTPWGPSTATLTTPANIESTYGANVFNPRSVYYTHQSLFAETILDQGNQIMVQRIIPENAPPPARMLLSLDFVAEPALPQYQRNSDGTYFLNTNGQKVQVTGSGATAAGFIGKWVLNSIPAESTYGEVATQAGSITNSQSVQSQLYPILEFEATFVGGQGNNQAFRLLVPTGADATNPLNVAEAERVGAWILRMQMLTRVSPTASWTILNTQQGQTYSDFTLLPNAYDDTTDQNLDFDFVLGNSYSANTPGYPVVYGPFENGFIYQSNLKTIMAEVGTAEASYGTLPSTTFTGANDPNLYLVNLFSAVSLENVPYYSLTLQGTAAGGQIFTSNSAFPAVGGGDGTMTQASFDSDVATWIGGFDDLDMAMYPFSVIYDSGFSLTTKYALASLLGQRPDIWLMLATQIATEPQNTPDQDLSTAQALSAMVGTYPESVVYGTAACRAAIIGGSGYLLSGQYSGIVPLSLQLAQTFAAYMGAANGQWNATVPPDENPQNIITLFENTNTAYMTATARNAAWEAGLVWAEAFDMQSQYFPALASVYTNDTSVLKALMNVIIAVDLIKIAHQARRTLSGISSLTSAQFVQRSNQLITNLVKGRYAGRVQIVPNTYYTAADTANGYSWSCAITMYANNMMTVGTATVIAQRMSAYTASTGNSG
jgi:hypothetical protein